MATKENIETETISPVGEAHAEAMDANALAEEAYREALEEFRPAENLARLIIHRRTELRLTQREVAERMGTSYSVISRLESGRSRPSLDTLQRLAEAFESTLVLGFVSDSEDTPAERELAAVS